MLDLDQFPDSWKTAAVIPILKPGKDPTQPENYRRISLLPVLSKIAEKIKHNRLLQHLKNHDIIIHEQHGFVPSHQLIRVVEYIKIGFYNKQYTGPVFLDIQKAFDRDSKVYFKN
ncbi:RNA-directed DNA polymerase from mobile element jockey [Nephila pilipes]|uniref:RNA-directed DNA polymerase from mobile element jockey n=1 Tax=Nephila pilipes TaxID=299642 RepID=A0A8X6QI87_NEPPI|nr:RNA-directed DNA polymerase from mobile element jockey [Nephila pilipes]